MRHTTYLKVTSIWIRDRSQKRHTHQQWVDQLVWRPERLSLHRIGFQILLILMMTLCQLMMTLQVNLMLLRRHCPSSMSLHRHWPWCLRTLTQTDQHHHLLGNNHGGAVNRTIAVRSTTKWSHYQPNYNLNKSTTRLRAQLPVSNCEPIPKFWFCYIPLENTGNSNGPVVLGELVVSPFVSRLRTCSTGIQASSNKPAVSSSSERGRHQDINCNSSINQIERKSYGSEILNWSNRDFLELLQEFLFQGQMEA